MTNSELIMRDSFFLVVSLAAATGAHVLDRALGMPRRSPQLVTLVAIAFLLVFLTAVVLPCQGCSRCRRLPFAVSILGALSILTPFALACGLGFSVIRRIAHGGRRRGRIECARCGYDLRGSASKRCPECGELAPLP